MKNLAVALACLALGTFATAQEWRRLPSLPDAEGFAGSFAGMSDGALIVAGGANFPDKKPWQGGTKVWYDDVYILEEPEAEWKLAGKLPRPLGYGVSVTHRCGVVCVGGSDATRHYADSFRLTSNRGKILVSKLPSLPVPIANACGALVGETLFVAGGQESPTSTTASKALWSIDLAAPSPKWSRLADIPGEGRILATAASLDGDFWIVGGASLHQGDDGSAARRYLVDAYRYAPSRDGAKGGWTRIADLPHPSVAAPSPAPTSAKALYLLGGDDGSQIGAAPADHRGFRKTALRYDVEDSRWSEVGELPAPRVTVPCFRGFGAWVVPSGEIRPGVRSPEVWAFREEDRL